MYNFSSFQTIWYTFFPGNGFNKNCEFWSNWGRKWRQWWGQWDSLAFHLDWITIMDPIQKGSPCWAASFFLSFLSLNQSFKIKRKKSTGKELSRKCIYYIFTGSLNLVNCCSSKLALSCNSVYQQKERTPSMRTCEGVSCNSLYVANPGSFPSTKQACRDLGKVVRREPNERRIQPCVLTNLLRKSDL